MSKEATAREILARMSSKEPEELTPEMDLVADLGIDSVRALELLVELEDGLDVEISDEDASTMDTVGDILAFVRNL